MGNRDNRPLSPGRAAELMRDVAADEIPPLVDELNRRYAARRRPVPSRRRRGRLPADAARRVSPPAQPFLRPHPRGPAVAGRHRRAGAGGLSAADSRARRSAVCGASPATTCWHIWFAAGCCGSSGPTRSGEPRTITRPIASCGCSTCNRWTTCRGAKIPARHEAAVFAVARDGLGAERHSIQP